MKFPGGGEKPGETQQEGGKVTGTLGVTYAKQTRRARGGGSRQYSVRPWPARRVVGWFSLSSHPLILSSSHQQPSELAPPRPPAARERLSANRNARTAGWWMEEGDPNETRAWSPRFQRPGSRSTRPTRRRGLPRPALAGGGPYSIPALWLALHSSPF